MVDISYMPENVLVLHNDALSGLEILDFPSIG